MESLTSVLLDGAIFIAVGIGSLYFTRLTGVVVDEKLSRGLHDSLRRGANRALQEGWAAGIHEITDAASQYAKRYNGGAIAHFKLSDDRLTEIAMAEAATVLKEAGK